MRRVTVLVAVLLVPAACAAAAPQDYVLGPEDVLEVLVHDNNDLNRLVAVSQEGAISLPLIGTVTVEGLTAIELERTLVKRYADGYLKKPQVTVFIREYRSKKVYVLGAVNRPGTYALTKATSALIEMIGKAEGVHPEAGVHVMRIRPLAGATGPRRPDEARAEEIAAVDLKALLEGDYRRNLEVRPGDTVYVAHKLDLRAYVLGEVQKPGAYPVERQSTLIEMMSKAGGITADVGLQVLLVRPRDTSRTGPLRPDEARQDEIQTLDLKAVLDGHPAANVRVMANDTVFVPHKSGQVVYVLGQVQRPGAYPLTRSARLIEMLSKAQGVTEDAGPEVILVRPRTDRSGPVTPDEAESGELTTVDLQALLGGDQDKNVPVKENDTLFIPKAPVFFVFGEVKKPGRFKIREKGLTVLKAISMAEGFTEKASKRRVKILREIQGVKTEVRVHLHDLVQPDDTIMVPESFF